MQFPQFSLNWCYAILCSAIWISARELQSHHCWLTMQQLLPLRMNNFNPMWWLSLPLSRLVSPETCSTQMDSVGLAEEATAGNPHARIKVVPATHQRICCAGRRKCRRGPVFWTESQWNCSIDPQGLKSKVGNWTVRTPHLFGTWHEL